MLFRFFQHSADAFLFRDVVIQFQDVTFRLFGALAFNLRARVFGFFSLPRRRFYLAEISVVAEIDDSDEWNRNEKSVETRRAYATDNDSRADCTGKICN